MTAENIAMYIHEETLDQFTIRMDGTILDPDGDEYDIADVEAAVIEAKAALDKWMGKLLKAHAIITAD